MADTHVDGTPPPMADRARIHFGFTSAHLQAPAPNRRDDQLPLVFRVGTSETPSRFRKIRLRFVTPSCAGAVELARSVATTVHQTADHQEGSDWSETRRDCVGHRQRAYEIV
jgi:hypothetical protein